MKRKALSLRRRQPTPPMPKVAWILLGTFLLLLLLLVARSIQRHSALITWRNALSDGATATPWPPWKATWPPLAKPPGMATRAFTGDWQGPYAFAALNSESLRFIPCYCGCRREGHQSVLACYMKGFTPDGVPMWSDHAFTCETCVNIVREVLLMSRQGTSPRAIRASIDEHHGGVLTRPTDTPLPK